MEKFLKFGDFWWKFRFLEAPGKFLEFRDF